MMIVVVVISYCFWFFTLELTGFSFLSWFIAQVKLPRNRKWILAKKKQNEIKNLSISRFLCRWGGIKAIIMWRKGCHLCDILKWNKILSSSQMFFCFFLPKFITDVFTTVWNERENEIKIKKRIIQLIKYLQCMNIDYHITPTAAGI